MKKLLRAMSLLIPTHAAVISRPGAQRSGKMPRTSAVVPRATYQDYHAKQEKDGNRDVRARTGITSAAVSPTSQFAQTFLNVVSTQFKELFAPDSCEQETWKTEDDNDSEQMKTMYYSHIADRLAGGGSDH